MKFIRKKHHSKIFLGVNSIGCCYRAQVLGTERSGLHCLATFAECFLRNQCSAIWFLSQVTWYCFVNTVPSSDGWPNLLLAFSMYWFLHLLSKLPSFLIFISHKPVLRTCCRYISFSPQNFPWLIQSPELERIKLPFCYVMKLVRACKSNFLNWYRGFSYL